MLESPFRFYRGAAAIMAADLGASPDTGLTVQLCGDAHLLNFRLLASPERHLVFDINDFDETLCIRDRSRTRPCGSAYGPTGCGCGSSPGCARWTSGTPRTTPTPCRR